MKEETIQKYFKPIWEICQEGIKEIDQNRYNKHKMYLAYTMCKENIYGATRYLNKLKPEIDFVKTIKTRDLILDTLQTYYDTTINTGQEE